VKSEESKSVSDILDTGLITMSEENWKTVQVYTDFAKKFHSEILSEDQIVDICLQENFVSAKIESYIKQYIKQVRDLEAARMESNTNLVSTE
jgi:hypothetical protein